MRFKQEPKRKRDIRKRRSSNEPRLKEALRAYLKFTASNTTPTVDETFKVVRPIRWALFGLTYDHLKLTRDWSRRNWFLELPDITAIKFSKESNTICEIDGEIIWWAEGKDAEGEWWPQGRTPNENRWGGKYMVEPFRAKVFPMWNKKHGLKYEIKFGGGSSYKFFTNRN